MDVPVPPGGHGARAQVGGGRLLVLHIAVVQPSLEPFEAPTDLVTDTPGASSAQGPVPEEEQQAQGDLRDGRRGRKEASRAATEGQPAQNRCQPYHLQAGPRHVCRVRLVWSGAPLEPLIYTWLQERLRSRRALRMSQQQPPTFRRRAPPLLNINEVIQGSLCFYGLKLGWNQPGT